MSAHRPVLLAEVMAAIAPRDGAIYVDGTFGGGGYSRALLGAADCRVWGIDRDPDAVAGGEAMARRYDGRLRILHGRYGNMESLLAGDGVDLVDGVALDVGVSSMQIDIAERGFSFRHDGPLDMRMEQTGPSAADFVNHADEGELADVIHYLGEERRARRIARAIVHARRVAPIKHTLRLAEIVRSASASAKPPRPRGETIDPATRTFQAIRIHINDEIGELVRGLAAAESMLRAGGRLAVVTFHSLEDREVKTFLARRAGRAPRASRHAPEADDGPAPSFRLLSRRPIRPGAEETENNPRARSARLRAAERTDAPAWGVTP
jgi:16S rRNA (cytosine1402-N4)-methyltransferase